MLLATRVKILEYLGCSAASVTNAEAYRAYILAEVPNLIVFCQTLEVLEWVEASNFAVFHCRNAHLLLMCTRSYEVTRNPRLSLMPASVGPDVFAKSVLDRLHIAH